MAVDVKTVLAQKLLDHARLWIKFVEFSPKCSYIASKTVQPGEQLLVRYEGEERSCWGALKIKSFPHDPKDIQTQCFFKTFLKGFSTLYFHESIL